MRRRKQNERGFALLFVFAMASAVAVMLYLEMPRLAVQSQRGKEQLLVDRGEQYKRAIQVFVRNVKKYPQSIDELEKFQDKRYLRRRYKDPFTGNDDWRLIHIENGVFTDSKIHKPPQNQEKDAPRQTFVGELPSIGNPNASGLNDPNAPNAALQRRASDRPAVAAGTETGGGETPAGPNAPPADPNAPAAGVNPAGVPPIPGQPGAPPVIPGIPGLVPAQPGGSPVNPAQTAQPQQPSTPSFIGGGVSNSQTGGTSSSVFIGGAPSPAQPQPQTQQVPIGGLRPGTPGAPFPTGVAQGGAGQVPQAAADLIRNLLTTPRAGGQPGVQGAPQGGLGSGIAGVASKHEGEGIKIYNERSRYEEWEFLYNQQEDALQQAAGQMQQAAGQGQNPQQGNPLNPGLGGGGLRPGGTGGGAFGGPPPQRRQ
jgi:type II secretory pathway pseudopilin PulG